MGGDVENILILRAGLRVGQPYHIPSHSSSTGCWFVSLKFLIAR